MKEIHAQHPTALENARSTRPSRAERRLAEQRAEIERLKLRQEAAQEREFRATEWAQERGRIRASARRERDADRSQRRTAQVERLKAAAVRLRRTFILVGAIVGVNLVAVAGQVAAFHDGFGWALPSALGAAAVVESIAIYVGWHAHTALIEGDSVFRLRAASYGIALVVGGLNYHHYAPDWQPTDQAVMFGLASLLSPWLWAIHSRHLNRQQLRAGGLIDPRAPKFSMLRWLLHARETWRALKWAVRYGEQSPSAAIAAVQAEVTAQATPDRDDDLTDLVTLPSIAYLPPRPLLAHLELLDEATGDDAVSDAAVVADSVTSQATSDGHDSDQVGDRSPSRLRPDDEDNRTAETWIRAQCRGKNGQGRKPSKTEVAERFGFSTGWAWLRLSAVAERMTAQGYRFQDNGVVVAPAKPVASADPEGDRAERVEVSAGVTA